MTQSPGSSPSRVAAPTPPLCAEKTEPFVILAEDHTLPFVNVFMNFRASPAFDPAGRAGLGTLAARLLPRGTLRRDRNALEEAIEARQARGGRAP
jgi:predicted Zn-dependent peptidase